MQIESAGNGTKNGGGTHGNGRPASRRRRSEPALERLLDALHRAKEGDFSVRLPKENGGGVHDELAAAFNEMVAMNEALSAEMVRVEQVVGREGRMTERAGLGAVNGGWGRCVQSMNALIGDLVQPTTEVARVIGAVAKGDLGQKMALEIDGQPMRGEFLRIGTTVNTMVDQLSSFSAEVTRVAREVGTDGKLGGQAEVQGVSGVWKDLTDNVNQMASNLTTQVRGIVRVVTSVANGDLSQRLVVDAKGEIAALADTLNSMTKTLGVFAEQVTSVARTVGVEGRLGAQAMVPGVAGTWKDLTDNVNLLANNLTAQVRNIADVTTAVANGDLSKKISVDARGEVNELKNTINTMVDQLRSFASEVTRVAKEVGTDGKLGAQATVPGVAGTWKDLTDNVNVLAGNLTTQVRNIAKVTTAVANGDLSQKITVDVRGEIAELKNTINTMVDQLRNFASEVTRVAREVGTEGKLGGQADVPGVAGTWKNLTDNVNIMASNLTTQVRGIVKVVTAVANGDLQQKFVLEAKGEVAALAETINSMTDTLSTFAEQVTRVAREVGVEGKLGGQAQVPGVGTWRQLTDNVNQLAGNLTTQVRAISDVATAVTKGDLTRSIDVKAQGEVAQLKDTINQMIANLRDTTRKNTEQDWLKTNLAKFSGMMQGQKSLENVSRLIMSELTPLVSAHHGAFFLAEEEGKAPVLKLKASYAYKERKTVSNRFELGEGLVGQCALEKKSILLTHCPPDYIRINSGLGEAAPLNVIVLPVLFEGQVKAVIELASFHAFSAIHQLFLDQLMESVGVVLNMIAANMRTEQLLQQSQSLTQELQSQSKELTEQQDELKRTNAALEKQALELEDKARLLEEQKEKVETKNREVEQARSSLEEKAEQLSLISKYKSEFLANMSHELRTPLNSLLILAKLLADNGEKNLTEKQVEYARTIHSSGGDLLALINEILDLSKVEAGKMKVDPREVTVGEVAEFVQRSFSPIAEQKGLEFAARLAPSAPSTLRTDPQRLHQVLKNLLANAFKFTEKGRIELMIHSEAPKSGFSNEALMRGGRVVAFSVIDTGIGIPKDKQRIIFEAFQQADGTTSRKYGGTGLGLSISREIARLLGGEIQVESTPGKGSTFTFYLPERYVGVPSEGEPDEPPKEDVVVRGSVLPGLEQILNQPVEDDRESITPGDRTLLVIEDDVRFAKILRQMAREKGFKVFVATRGDTGLTMANEHRPDAITLDLQLPGIDGWAVLDRLKRNPRTRHIPVHVISVVDRRHRGVTLGAFAWLEKPVDRDTIDAALTHINTYLDKKVKLLLVVEDDDAQRNSIAELLRGDDVEVTAVRDAESAVQALETAAYDCMVVDLMLPGVDGFALIERLKTQPRYESLPVIVYTGKDLTPEEERRLKSFAESVVVKSGIKSPERLIEETGMFLHRVAGKPPVRTQAARVRADLEGVRVLIVDDDVRNIFALTSMLEHHHMEVAFAESGMSAVDMLEKDGGFDVVLLDVMMPGMDGYETARAIRARTGLASLPIIAVTAKALAEDREKCLAAGCSEYLSKPVDEEKLLDLIGALTGGRKRRDRG